jgi:hypothetical protein
LEFASLESMLSFRQQEFNRLLGITATNHIETLQQNNCLEILSDLIKEIHNGIKEKALDLGHP